MKQDVRSKMILEEFKSLTACFVLLWFKAGSINDTPATSGFEVSFSTPELLSAMLTHGSPAELQVNLLASLNQLRG